MPRLRFWNDQKYVQQTSPGFGELPWFGPMVALKSANGMLTRCQSVSLNTGGSASYRLLSLASCPFALQKTNAWYHCALSNRAQ